MHVNIIFLPLKLVAAKWMRLTIAVRELIGIIIPLHVDHVKFMGRNYYVFINISLFN